MDRFTPQGQAVTLFGATRGCLPMTPTLPVPAATPSRSFCSGRSPKKRPSAATSPSIHVLFSPLPLLAKRSPSFCTFSSFSHPSKAGAARPQPTLLRAQEPHFVGAPCSCPPRWGSTSTLGGGRGAAAIPPHSAFPAVGGIHGQGEIRPRGRDSTGCTEDLFIAQDGWLQVVWLGGTVAVILFMMCFQNLSKQKTTKTNNNKKNQKGSGFSSRGAKCHYLIHFLLQTSAEEPM